VTRKELWGRPSAWGIGRSEVNIPPLIFFTSDKSTSSLSPMMSRPRSVPQSPFVAHAPFPCHTAPAEATLPPTICHGQQELRQNLEEAARHARRPRPQLEAPRTPTRSQQSLRGTRSIPARRIGVSRRQTRWETATEGRIRDPGHASPYRVIRTRAVGG
jgi:hypothetical protein